MPDLDGIYRISDGTVIGRSVGGSFMTAEGAAIALTATAAALDSESRSQSEAPSGSTTDDNEPKVCPDPGPDVPHGTSPNAITYQSQVSKLPPGMAVTLNGVTFDGCRTTDGTMLEAKGTGYAQFLTSLGWPDWYKGGPEMEQQMRDQAAAAGGRTVE